MAFSSFLFSMFFFVSLLASKLAIGTVISEADGCARQRGNHSKLFVFGDSYADTGNLGRRLGRNIARSWFPPYGMSFPRKPTGRFSDGRVLTDFIASCMRIGSPVPYRMRRAQGAGPLASSRGMNFAVAGSGVFDTGNFQRNLALQIDQFESQIDAGVFSGCDVRDSAALVAVSGNDYLHLAQRDPRYLLLDLDRFMSGLFAELKRDLKRLERIGVAKVMVTNLHPIGCTPYYTRPTNYTRCSADVSSAVAEHNRRLGELMSELGSGAGTSFLGLDVHAAISSLLRQEKFGRTLAPCCESRGEGGSCGQVDEEGKEVYRVCGRPEEHLYWDAVHPTQAAWAAAFEFLRPPVQNFLRF